MVSSERIFSLLDHEQFVPDAADAVDFVGLRQGIEIRDLHFAYDGSNMVLHGVSLSIPKGKTVAIVGHTGAGKSSIINVLTRFYEYQAGEVLVDGVSLRLIRQKSFRRKLAIVLQDVFLFSRSIADNISLGTSGISREAIENAGRAVGIHDFVMQLPRGYDTVLSERGSTLSTGQKQLLSFARALAHDPELLILDEATANVDTATELLIEEATATLLKGRTSIVIAHRLSTIRNADTIVVMHHGRVHETGTHDELLRKGGLYAKLYTLQQTSSAA
jgi:ATP-binding cassette subfamily B protein